MKPLYELTGVRCRRGNQIALDGIGFQLSAGEFTAICGLNGAGKSTLLEAMSGLLPYEGECRFEGRPLAAWNPREFARRVSLLPQSTDAAPSFLVEEVVRMGRYPYESAWTIDPHSEQACRQAMELSGCAEFAGRPIDELSGGERQRVLFAAALAQQPAALVLDEPGTFVDLPHQVQMFATLRDLCRKGLLCVTATHDLNLAAAFCSRLILLDRGRLAADGTPAEVLTGAEFARIFGGRIRVDMSGGAVRVHYAV